MERRCVCSYFSIFSSFKLLEMKEHYFGRNDSEEDYSADSIVECTLAVLLNMGSFIVLRCSMLIQ